MNIYHMLLKISYSESVYPIIPVKLLNHVSGTILKFVHLLVVNNNKYLSHVVDSIIFRISVPDYPSRTVESKSLRLFCNLVYFVYFIFIQTTIYLHMTNSKVRNSDSSYSTCFSQVLLKLFISLINTVDKEIYNIFNSFLFPSTLIQTGQTNKQTNKHTTIEF